jgi:hypothetical protein
MMPRSRVDLKRRLDRRLVVSVVAVGLCGAALATGALVSFGPATCVSVATGAAIATANLWALAYTVVALLPQRQSGPHCEDHEGRTPFAWVLAGLLKTFCLVVLVWVLMRYGLVSPVPLLVGFGALPIGIAIGSVVSDRGALSDSC